MTVYPAYLLCLLLMMPAFALTALVRAMELLDAGPKQLFLAVVNVLAFVGSGIAEPLRYGWRILLVLAVGGFVVLAGAIPQLRTQCFYGLGTVGAVCIAYCLFAATRVGTEETISALVVLIPSIIGVAACAWFAARFGGG